MIPARTRFGTAVNLMAGRANLLALDRLAFLDEAAIQTLSQLKLESDPKLVNPLLNDLVMI